MIAGEVAMPVVPLRNAVLAERSSENCSCSLQSDHPKSLNKHVLCIQQNHSFVFFHVKFEEKVA